MELNKLLMLKCDCTIVKLDKVFTFSPVREFQEFRDCVVLCSGADYPLTTLDASGHLDKRLTHKLAWLHGTIVRD